MPWAAPATRAWLGLPTAAPWVAETPRPERSRCCRPACSTGRDHLGSGAHPGVPGGRGCAVPLTRDQRRRTDRPTEPGLSPADPGSVCHSSGTIGAAVPGSLDVGPAAASPLNSSDAPSSAWRGPVGAPVSLATLEAAAARLAGRLDCLAVALLDGVVPGLLDGACHALLDGVAPFDAAAPGSVPDDAAARVTWLPDSGPPRAGRPVSGGVPVVLAVLVAAGLAAARLVPAGLVAALVPAGLVAAGLVAAEVAAAVPATTDRGDSDAPAPAGAT